MLPALLWSVGFTLVVVIALAALGLALFVMHAIAYGGDSVLGPCAARTCRGSGCRWARVRRDGLHVASQPARPAHLTG